MTNLIYFSSTSENTHRFVSKLGVPAARIPLLPKDPFLVATEPFILLTPTYGGGNDKGAVPRQVIKFLNHPENRQLLAGVIASGNTNFGEAYCIAGPIIASKCGVPYMYSFELMGTPEDVEQVSEGLRRFWQQQKSQTP